MHFTTLVATTMAALAAAAPTPAAAKKPYIAVSLFLHIHNPGQATFEEPSPQELYQLLNYHQAKNVVKINFEHDQAYGVDINSVVCQAYSDKLGQQPLGSFTNTQPLKFNSPATVGSVICYDTVAT